MTKPTKTIDRYESLRGQDAYNVFFDLCLARAESKGRTEVSAFDKRELGDKHPALAAEAEHWERRFDAKRAADEQRLKIFRAELKASKQYS